MKKTILIRPLSITIKVLLILLKNLSIYLYSSEVNEKRPERFLFYYTIYMILE